MGRSFEARLNPATISMLKSAMTNKVSGNVAPRRFEHRDIRPSSEVNAIARQSSRFTKKIDVVADVIFGTDDPRGVSSLMPSSCKLSPRILESGLGTASCGVVPFKT